MDFLKEQGRGEGFHTLFAKFKKFMKICTQKGVFVAKPVADMTIPIDKFLKKEILTLEEIKLLVDTKNMEKIHILGELSFSAAMPDSDSAMSKN